jgi:hypothetical protein
MLPVDNTAKKKNSYNSLGFQRRNVKNIFCLTKLAAKHITFVVMEYCNER